MDITYTRSVIEDSRTYGDTDAAIAALLDDLNSLLAEHWEWEPGEREGNDVAEAKTRTVVHAVEAGAADRALESAGAWEWTYPAPEGAEAVVFRLERVYGTSDVNEYTEDGITYTVGAHVEHREEAWRGRIMRITVDSYPDSPDEATYHVQWHGATNTDTHGAYAIELRP